MELLTMGTWLIVGLIGLPLGRGVLLGRMSFGLQALAGLGGMGLMILYVALEGPTGLAWAAGGVAVVGALAVTTAAVGLLADSDTASTPAAQALELSSSGWAGIQLWLFLVVAVLSAITAANGTANF
jgi:hypothetical protein